MPESISFEQALSSAATSRETSTPSTTATPPEGTTTPGASSTPTLAPDSGTGSAGTTTPPASGTQSTPQPAGEPPQERWPTILENARTKAATEALAKFRGDHGWDERTTSQSIRSAIDFARRITELGPIGFITEYIKEVQGDPLLATQLRSQAARTLRSGRGNGTAAVDANEPAPEPDLDLDPGNPNSVRLFSASQLAKREQWFTRTLIPTLLSAVRGELEPVVGEVKLFKDAREQARAITESQEMSKSIVGKMRGLTHFKENEAAIKTKFAELTGPSVDHPDGVDDPALLRELMYDAYLHVLHHDVLPGLSRKEQATVLGDLRTRAVASTVNPSAPTASTPTRPKTFEEALRQQAAKRAS